MQRKITLLIITLLISLFLIACRSEDPYRLELDEEMKAIEVELEKEKAVIPIHTEGAQLVWQSSNPSVATVDDGVIKGIALGSAIITVSINNTELKIDITVTVVPEVIVPIVPTRMVIVGSDEIVIGDDEEYTVTVTPTNASKDVMWGVDNQNIATIDASGKLSAKTVGTVEITAMSRHNERILATKKVTITHQEATSVTINSEATTVIEGETLTLTATVLPALASQEVVWTVSDEGVATIENGLLTALTAGEVIITATAKDTEIKAELHVTITPASSLNTKTFDFVEGGSVYGYAQDTVLTITSNQDETYTKSWFVSCSQYNSGVFYLGANNNNKGLMTLNYTGVNSTFNYADLLLNEAITNGPSAAIVSGDDYTFDKVVFSYDGGNKEFTIFIAYYDNESASWIIDEGTATGELAFDTAGIVELRLAQAVTGKIAIIAIPSDTFGTLRVRSISVD